MFVKRFQERKTGIKNELEQKKNFTKHNLNKSCITSSESEIGSLISLTESKKAKVK